MKRTLKIILAIATVTLLSSVVYAASNMNPTTQFVGEGDPTGIIYRDGDTYIDTVSLNMWIFNGTSSTWTTLARFSQPLANGTDGEDGAKWWLVEQDPTTLPDFGNDYDFCLDRGTWNVWHKLGGQWQLTGNIKGADGINGTNGTNGIDGKDGINGTNGTDGISGTDGRDGIDGIEGTNGLDGKDGLNGTDGKDGIVWYNDLAYTLSADLGKDGDYFMFANGTVEYKIDGTWVFFTSLMGQKGDTGETGIAGATGSTGATGPQGEQGIQGIKGIPDTDGINGTNGIDGINGTNGIDGINGTNGIDGRDGIDGTSGIDGTDGIDVDTITWGANGINGKDGIVPWWLYVVTAVALAASAYSVYKSRQKPKSEDVEKHNQKMPKALY